VAAKTSRWLHASAWRPTSHITIGRDDDGSFTAAWGGYSETDWDSSATLFYYCQACGKTLPDDYAAALDALLGNERTP